MDLQMTTIGLSFSLMRTQHVDLDYVERYKQKNKEKYSTFKKWIV